MGIEKKTSFLEEVKRLFDQGRPAAALDMVYRFSEVVFELKDELQLLYWRQRAIGEFLTGGTEEAPQALEEAGGATKEFLDEYEIAFTAFASRRLPRRKRRRTRHEGLIKYNIGQIVLIAQQLGDDGDEVGQRMAEVTPRS